MKQDRVLIVDDERRMCLVLKTAIESESIAVTTANSGESALAALTVDTFDVIISDIKMPGISGIDLLERVKQNNPETEVLLMTAFADTKTAVNAMKMGAFDYIIKPFEIEELRHKINNILEKKQLKSENKLLKKKLSKRYSLENIIGKSGAMQRVFELVDKVSNSDATVLVRGESGTGKELIAQAIHNISFRKDKPFLAVNCGALPETLLESELFGYEKGAFTGADKQKPGMFEIAADGTIFLDEIGDMTPATQVKLLRVLQAKEIIRVGGTKTIPIHARTIAATNKNLEQAVKEKLFREDLYYRINVFPIFLPPLRDRVEDIPDLVSFFLQQQNKDEHAFDPIVVQLLMKYSWPGNVRELENVIERSLILAGENNIQISNLPPHIRGEAEMPFAPDISPENILPLDEMERRMIQKALSQTEGNKTKAAAILGITRRQLYSMMERLWKK